MARLVPKHCIVHAIELDGTVGGRATVYYRCVRDGHMETGQYQYSIKGGGFSNYPRKVVKAHSVSFRGSTVTGQARVGFVLSPANAVCFKQGREINCKLEGDTNSPGLQGLSAATCGSRYGRLSYKQKKRLPASVFALPGRRFPMPDAAHAANAKARARQALNRGTITKREFEKVTRKANSILKRCGGAR